MRVLYPTAEKEVKLHDKEYFRNGTKGSPCRGARRELSVDYDPIGCNYDKITDDRIM